LKKAALVLIVSVLMFGFAAGNAFAESELDKTVDELIGVKYKYGGTTAKGFDCSGFTMYVFNAFGIELPHQSKAQAKLGSAVDKKELRAGDLVFFNTDGKGISHVGIYLGGGEFVHSASDKGVVKNKLSETYYMKTYVTARRVLDEDTYARLTSELGQ
jgi:cell wall-associated NlpC family hydrolase